MINRITLIGNTGKDPEVRTLQSGKRVASFSLATSETHKGQDGAKIVETQWHNVKLWGNLAEVAERYIKKGQLLYIEGKVVYSSYDDKDGNKRYITEIIGYNVQMLGKKTEANEPADGKQDAPISDTKDLESDDDLPF